MRAVEAIIVLFHIHRAESESGGRVAENKLLSQLEMIGGRVVLRIATGGTGALALDTPLPNLICNTPWQSLRKERRVEW